MQEILRIDRVSQVTGLPKKSIYNLMNKGAFPRPIKLAAKAVGWPSSDIEAWIEARIAASRAEQQAEA